MTVMLLLVLLLRLLVLPRKGWLRWEVEEAGLEDRCCACVCFGGEGRSII